MTRLKLNLFLMTSLYVLNANPGLDSSKGSGFDPEKAFRCEVVDEHREIYADPQKKLRLGELSNSENRKMFIEETEWGGQPIELQVTCQLQDEHYKCSWSDFYYIIVDLSQAWKTQVLKGQQVWVEMTGEWYKGIKYENPVKIQCRQRLN